MRTGHQIFHNVLHILWDQLHLGHHILVKGMDSTMHYWWYIPHIILTLKSNSWSQRSRIIDGDQLLQNRRTRSSNTNDGRRDRDRNFVLLHPLIFRILHQHHTSIIHILVVGVLRGQICQKRINLHYLLQNLDLRSDHQ
jgi:hypothetical protein